MEVLLYIFLAFVNWSMFGLGTMKVLELTTGFRYNTKQREWISAIIALPIALIVSYLMMQSGIAFTDGDILPSGGLDEF